MRKLVAVSIIMVLTAWAATAWANQFVGIWKAGDQSEMWVVTFNADGTFTRQVTKPGQPVYKERGTYRIQGNQMFVQSQGEAQGYYLQFRFADANTLELFEEGKMLARMIRQSGGVQPPPGPTVQTDPKQAVQVFQAGLQQLRQGGCAKAMPYFQKTAQLDPNFVGGYRGMGMCLRQTKRYPEAVAAYSKALQIKPQDGMLYYGRAATYAMMGKGPEALADAEKAVQLRPNDSKARELRDIIKRKMAEQSAPRSQSQGKGYQLRGNTIILDPNAPTGTVVEALKEQQRRQQQ